MSKVSSVETSLIRIHIKMTTVTNAPSTGRPRARHASIYSTAKMLFSSKLLDTHEGRPEK
jgi:hypothetical protein